MESLSQTVPNKIRTNGFQKTAYDDVFGGPPKTFSPRVEDYGEIFGGFRSSSAIPVLDLPTVDDAEVFFDVRGSRFDYSEIFGGFDFDFPCVELFDRVIGGDEFSDKSWTSADIKSLSDNSAASARSGKSQSLTNGDCHPPFDGIEQFNILNHEATETSKIDLPYETHLTRAPIHPEFTFLIDENFTPHMMGDINAPTQVIDDINLNTDFIENDVGSKHLRKILSHSAKNTSDCPTLRKDIDSLRSYSQNGSYHDATFITVAEINLRTHPSQVPPPSRPPPIRKGNSGEMDSELKGTKNNAFEEIIGDSSPPFFDVEVDASSSAATSAAAMKEAMEKAHAKLRSAKVMGRKIRSDKLGSKGEIKDKNGNISKTIDGYNNLNDMRLCGTDEEESVMNFFAGEEKQKFTETSQGVPYSVEEGEFFSWVESSTPKRGKELCSSLGSYKTEVVGEWKEANDFFELVETDKLRNTSEQCHQSSNGKIQVENMKSQASHQKEKKIVMEASEQQDNNSKKLNPARAAWELEENKKKLKISEEAQMQKEHEKEINVAYEQRDTKECDIVINVLPEENYVEFKETAKRKEIFQREKYKNQLRQALGLEETEEKSKQDLEKDEFDKRLREAHEKEKIEKKQKEAFEENERILKAALDQEENEKRLKKDFERNEYEKKQKEVLERVEYENNLKEALERKENEMRLKEAREKEDYENKLKENLEKKENEKRLKETLEKETNERKQKEAIEKEDYENKIKETLERQENVKRCKEALEKEANERKQREAIENEEYEKKRKKAINREEIEKSEACQREKNENRLEEAQKRQENEKMVEEVNGQGAVEKSRHNSTWEEDKKIIHDSVEGVKMHQANEGAVRDNNEKRPKMVHEDESTLNKEVNIESVQEIPAVEVSEKIIIEPKDGNNVVESVDDRFVASSVMQGDTVRSVLLDECVNKSGQTVNPPENTGAKKKIQECEPTFDSKKMEEKITHEWVEKRRNMRQGQVVYDQEENKDKSRTSQMVNEGFENGKQMADEKRSTKISAQHVNTSKSTETKGTNIHKEAKLELRVKEERAKKEKEVEQDRLRRLEEEREREREREKDRMDVERTTLEGRERVRTESRERAAVDRESAEARQRALMDAREKLEKACAEAREKSLADKASMEARIKAERAAVERATDMARERAMAACTSGSRHPYSSTYAGVEVESAQRCKARLERHQRTTERAAKALAEMNTRDFIAQREQAERHRFAESVDADVKRWSSGKERNLRALISTLQYILGPDSGWHPVPLTEVITAAAVKKAYRKATLCVHPDKLQQRGASIRQKYICEKVFDLLKEAWNRFNSEER